MTGPVRTDLKPLVWSGSGGVAGESAVAPRASALRCARDEVVHRQVGVQLLRRPIRPVRRRGVRRNHCCCGRCSMKWVQTGPAQRPSATRGIGLSHLPASFAPLLYMGAFGADRGVRPMAWVDPGVIVIDVKDPGLHITEQ